ncbi:FecR family protein [Chitinophaga parva]|nr:FecR family protein [Chitinophaga parva]
MTKEAIIALAEKVAAGTATTEELMQYHQVFRQFYVQPGWDESLMGHEAAVGAEIRRRLQPMLDRSRKARVMRIAYRWAAAAVVALLIGSGYFFLHTGSRAAVAPQAQRFKNDVPAPVGSHAILTLASGRQILLDSAGNGLLAQEGSLAVRKNQQGALVYNGAGSATAFNTVQVPTGGNAIHLVLADGSQVWVDAGSSLTYPTAFSAGTRPVTVTGQAYFEVTPDAHQPFQVKNGADRSVVQVLGTRFNIRAFRDENRVTVTLADGAVRVTTDKSSQLLQPGQQAVSQSNGDIQLTTTADLEAVMAWKDGLFYFNGNDIPTIMSDLERFYNVEVVYQTNVDERFVARIPRDVPISRVLDLIEMTNLVHFKIEGRRITVIR